MVSAGPDTSRLTDRLRELGEASLSAPLPDERYRYLFPTVGHAVMHSVMVHAAMHVGQLIVQRRAGGVRPCGNRLSDQETKPVVGGRRVVRIVTLREGW